MRWGILTPSSSFSSPALEMFSWVLWYDQIPERFPEENWGLSSGLGNIRQTKSRVGPDLPAFTLAAKKTQLSLVGTVRNSAGPGCAFAPSNYFCSLNSHILFDVMHCLTQSWRVAVTGCGLHSCQAAMITPAAAPGMSKDAMPQKHPHAQKKQGHKHCSGCRITAGCSALRELHRVSLWGNLRLLWTQAPGQAPHTLQ